MSKDANPYSQKPASGEWWPVGAVLVVIIGAFVVWTNGFPGVVKPQLPRDKIQSQTHKPGDVQPSISIEADLSLLKSEVWQLFEDSIGKSLESGGKQTDAGAPGVSRPVPDLQNSALTRSENSAIDYQEVQRLFSQVLTTGVTAEFVESWARLDFSVHEFSAAGQTIVAIVEAKQKSGRGLFVFRTSSAVPVALQAPHRFYDSRSGDIALAAFLESSCRAFCCNTIHRRKIDWAHATRETTCNAFTRAFANEYADGLVVQIHGFASSKRKTKSGRRSDVILSHGTRFPPVWTLRARHIFRQALPEFQISLFPEDTLDLGAETNVQGRLLRSHDGFLHVELNFDVRNKLQSDESARRRVFDTGLEQLYKIRKMDGSR